VSLRRTPWLSVLTKAHFLVKQGNRLTMRADLALASADELRRKNGERTEVMCV
jgi:hypothetical protein